MNQQSAPTLLQLGACAYWTGDKDRCHLFENADIFSCQTAQTHGWLYCCCTNIFILILSGTGCNMFKSCDVRHYDALSNINKYDSMLPQETYFKRDAPTKWGIAPPPSDAGCISRLLFFCATSSDVMSMSSKFVFCDCGHDSRAKWI